MYDEQTFPLLELETLDSIFFSSLIAPSLIGNRIWFKVSISCRYFFAYDLRLVFLILVYKYTYILLLLVSQYGLSVYDELLKN